MRYMRYMRYMCYMRYMRYRRYKRRARLEISNETGDAPPTGAASVGSVRPKLEGYGLIWKGVASVGRAWPHVAWVNVIDVHGSDMLPLVLVPLPGA